MGFGARNLSTMTYSRLSIAAAEDIDYKYAGHDCDWADIDAVEDEAVVLEEDENTVQVGEKYIPLGTVVFVDVDDKLSIADNTTTLVQGACWILEQTKIYTGGDTNIGNLVKKGHVFKAMVKAGGMGQPTFANLQAALPEVTFVTV